ncbi:hypothetical protein HDV05_003317 [Chytridiales sp. JEL 0842]|nr:hypothetical protein HDV05_003317 [Chytridiales sp. JEL 0842]
MSQGDCKAASSPPRTESATKPAFSFLSIVNPSSVAASSAADTCSSSEERPRSPHERLSDYREPTKRKRYGDDDDDDHMVENEMLSTFPLNKKNRSPAGQTHKRKRESVGSQLQSLDELPPAPPASELSFRHQRIRKKNGVSRTHHRGKMPPPWLLSSTGNFQGFGDLFAYLNAGQSRGRRDHQYHEIPRLVPGTPTTVALHHEIKQFANFLAPSASETLVRNHITSLYTSIILSRFPDAKVHRFGSTATGLQLPWSDIDLAIIDSSTGVDNSTQGQQASRLSKMAKKIKQKKTTSFMNVIRKARVPIIKITDRASNLNVDMSYNAPGGLDAVNYVRTWCEQIPALKELVLVFKHFLVVHELADVSTGGVGGYSAVLWMVAFLQLRKMPMFDPDAAETQHSHKKRRLNRPHDGCDAEDVNPDDSNEPLCLGRLFLDFCRIFSQEFDYHRLGIAFDLEKPTNGSEYSIPKVRLFDKKHSAFYNFKTPHTLCILDPLDPSTNVSKGSSEIQRVTSALSDALDAITGRCQMSKDMNGWDDYTLLGRVLCVPYEMLKSRWKLEECAKMYKHSPGLVPNSRFVDGRGSSVEVCATVVEEGVEEGEVRDPFESVLNGENNYVLPGIMINDAEENYDGQQNGGGQGVSGVGAGMETDAECSPIPFPQFPIPSIPPPPQIPQPLPFSVPQMPSRQVLPPNSGKNFNTSSQPPRRRTGFNGRDNRTGPSRPADIKLPPKHTTENAKGPRKPLPPGRVDDREGDLWDPNSKKSRGRSPIDGLRFDGRSVYSMSPKQARRYEQQLEKGGSRSVNRGKKPSKGSPKWRPVEQKHEGERGGKRTDLKNADFIPLKGTSKKDGAFQGQFRNSKKHRAHWD